MTSITDDSPDLAKVKFSAPFIVQIVTWIVATLLTYGAMSARIAVVETRQTESDRRQGDIDRRMERIEDKVDILLRRVQP